MIRYKALWILFLVLTMGVYLSGCRILDSAENVTGVEELLAENEETIEELLAEAEGEEESEAGEEESSGGEDDIGDGPVEGGDNTFLWKPVSDSDGNLVVLLPTAYRGNVDSCGVYRDGNGSRLVEEGRFHTDTKNGYRVHYRFSEPGSSYGRNIYCVAFLEDTGEVVAWFIPDGSQRYEY